MRWWLSVMGDGSGSRCVVYYLLFQLVDMIFLDTCGQVCEAVILRILSYESREQR